MGSAFGHDEMDRDVARRGRDVLHHLALERQCQENGAWSGLAEQSIIVALAITDPAPRRVECQAGHQKQVDVRSISS